MVSMLYATMWHGGKSRDAELKGYFMLKLILSSSILLSFVVACGTKDSKTPEVPGPRTEIPLNTPAEIVGVWSHCNAASENTSSSGTYIFTAEGGLLFRSSSYQVADCQGEGKELFVMEGQYLVGQNNTLDMILGKDSTRSSLYRVFSVQGKRLLISNNVSVGGTADNRDWDLGANTLVLNKVEF